MRHAVTLVEVLLALALLGVVLGIIAQASGFATRSTGILAPKLALQQASRKAVVRLLTELREGMLVVKPAPGSTLPYAVVKDKVGQLRWYHLVGQPGAPAGQELWCHVDDPNVPRAQRRHKLLGGIRRLAFTSRSEGALEVNLVLGEGTQEHALMTTVRLQNLAAGEKIW